MYVVINELMLQIFMMAHAGIISSGIKNIEET
jgi:hypothetical protein